MELENILTKEAIEEIYKDIYASKEYRKLADKHQQLMKAGKVAHAYSKKLNF